MTSKITPSEMNEKMHNNIGPQNKFITNSDGLKLYCRYWHPTNGVQPKGLVYICHGFGEHLQWYEDLALGITDINCIAFGHDHVGHGRSEGMRGHVNSAEDYCRDVIEHCEQLLDVYPDLPFLLVGHSMGGMIAIRTAMKRPEFFKGIVLMGPLIKPNPTEATPTKLFLARIVARILPYITVTKLKLEDVTRDSDIIARLHKDPLRYHGGIRAHWAITCQDVLDYFEANMDNVTWPFLILHGENDKLCDPEGSRQFYERTKSFDKELKLFPNARHHLYLELPSVRKEAIKDTVDWLQLHLDPPSK